MTATADGPPPAKALRPLLVTNDFPPRIGGIERFTLALATCLPAAAVLAPRQEGAADHDRQLPVPVYRASAPFMGPRARTVDEIHHAAAAHHANAVILLSPLPLALLGPRLRLPWVVVSHGAELEIPSRLPGLAAVLRARLRHAAALYAVSAYTAGRVHALLGVDGPPVRLLRNGVPLERFHPGLDGTPIRGRYGIGDAPLLVCVGRLVPRKGQDRLIEAMPAIRAHLPDAHLMLVGEGRMRSRLERASARLEGAVTFTGTVSGPELATHIAAADVFAHPNRSRWLGLEQEGFGIIFLEAQACGKPVIAGRSGGTPEALLEGESGLLVDGSAPDDIAEAAIRLLSDDELAARMGKAGRRFVEERFSWDDIARAFATDLAAVVAGDRLTSDL